MPRQGTAKRGKEDIPLLKIVVPAADFVRSSNVERDANNEAFPLSRYVLDASVIDVVRRLVESMNDRSHNRAFSITGSYGSGKSTLAVFLNSLLAPSSSHSWKQSSALLERQLPKLRVKLEDSRKSLKINNKGFISCMVTSRAEPIVATIVRALDRGTVNRHGTKYRNKPAFKKLARAVAAVNKAEKHGDLKAMPDAALIMDIVKEMCKEAPVLILLDEFGKNLEYFAHGNSLEGDLFVMQMLAEAGSGKKKLPLFIITMQHMAFEEYSSEISSANKKEWAKIQGRFEDIPFANSPQQVRNLVASFLTPTSRAKENARIRKWAEARFNELKIPLTKSGISKEQIARCYPVHPLSLAILPELCSRYGQHERTLLSFVASGEKYAIPEFLDHNVMSKTGYDLPTVGLDVLYDYFIAEHRSVHTTHSPSNMNRMMEIYLSIRDSNNLSTGELKVLKTIGLLNLLGTYGSFNASSRVLEYATGSRVGPILKSLLDKSIITYRKHTDEYRVWRGSDMDIQSAIHNARIQLEKASLVEVIDRVKVLNPIIASKHAIKTGTMRTFECHFVDSNIKNAIVIPPGVDGAIFYWADESRNYDNIPTHTRPVIIVQPRIKLDRLRNAAIHVLSIDEILATNTDIANDWVAKGELYERRVHGMSKVDEEFEEAYGRSSKWSYIPPHKKQIFALEHSGSAAASESADKAYSKCPIIRNEMLNRFQISTQSARARSILINGMINDLDKECFGIEGWGPERAMYEVVFRKTKLHKKSKKWKLDVKNNEINSVLSHIEEYIVKNRGRINVDTVYAMLREPPFGVKTGLMLVLIMIVMYNLRNKIALYEHGTLCTSLSEEIIERITKNPAHFEIKYFGQKIKKKQELINLIGIHLGFEAKSSIGLMDVVGLLIRTVSKLSNYTKKTKMLKNKKAMEIRDIILTATEPDVMLFESIPKALGYRSVTLLDRRERVKLANHISSIMDELADAHYTMLADLRQCLYSEIGVQNKKEMIGISNDLKDKISGDPHLQGTLNALSVETLSDDEWVNYFAMVLTNSPPTEWTDIEYKLYNANLSEFAGKVKRIIAIYREKLIGKNYDNMSRIAITQPDGKELVDVVAINNAQLKIAAIGAKIVLNEISKKKQFKNKEDARKALLAALSKM